MGRNTHKAVNMIKKSNKRVMLTFSKKLDKWLENVAKEMEMTKSQIVKWLLKKNIKQIMEQYTAEEYEKLVKIAKTKWIKEEYLDAIEDEEEE